MDESLLFRYIQGISSDEENARITAWLAQDIENEKIADQLSRIYFAWKTKERMTTRDPQVAFVKVQKQKQKKTYRRIFSRIAMAAACVALIAVASISYMRTGSSILPPAVQYVTVHSNPGIRTSLNLPDGTQVFLNSASTLTYPVPYDPKQRNVTLEGEAYFKVTHNPDQPFIVHFTHDELNVEVRGTEFNIQAYATDPSIQTTLVNGSVQLNTPTAQGTRFIQLSPSEKAIYDKTTHSTQVAFVNTIYDTAWMNGRLMFKETPIPEVLRRLAHYYNVSFEVKNTVINSYRFTGTFDNRQLSQVLDYLKISSDIDYRIAYATEDDSQGLQKTKVTLIKK